MRESSGEGPEGGGLGGREACSGQSLPVSVGLGSSLSHALLHGLVGGGFAWC